MAKRSPSKAKKSVRSVAVAPVSVSGTVDVVASAPTHDAIARRAYELFLARGGSHGSHEQDWLSAERELRAVC